MRTLVLTLVAAVACAGCAGSLLESNAAAPEVYRLQGTLPADRGDRLPLALGVTRPRAAPSLDSERIAVVAPDSRFDYFAGVRWAESAPQMVQQLLVQALAADGRFDAVVTSPSRVPAELLLDVELRRFEAVYAAGVQAPRVRVELQVSLVDPRQGRRLASFAAAAAADAASNRRPAVLEAFEAATADVLASVVTQVRSAADGIAR